MQVKAAKVAMLLPLEQSLEIIIKEYMRLRLVRKQDPMHRVHILSRLDIKPDSMLRVPMRWRLDIWPHRDLNSLILLLLMRQVPP